MGNIKWYVGQPIVCIQTHSQGAVRKGLEYTIQGVKQCKCGCIDLNVGIQSKIKGTICDCGNVDLGKIWWLGSELFAPLDVDISELTEMLTKEFQNK